jgi:putative two-component system response regulator
MKKRILFVDDEPNFLNGLRRMLRDKREEWDMTFVHSVDEALRALAEESYDAIVSDVNMPLKTGFDLLAALAANPATQTIPTIILTGNAESDLKRRALDMGATDLLNKPVLVEDLRARIQSALRLKIYQDALKAQNEVLEQRVRERTRELEISRLDIIWRLAKAGEYRDEDTGDHVLRVACCSRILAENLDLPRETVERIFLASPLHDIGKIGIPDGILLKRGSLSERERTLMETHCKIGANVLLSPPRGIEAFLEFQGIEEAVALLEAAHPLREMRTPTTSAGMGPDIPVGCAGTPFRWQARLSRWRTSTTPYVLSVRTRPSSKLGML